MARKSRKNKERQTGNEGREQRTERYAEQRSTAAYIRLSGENEEGDSIQSQISLVHDYIRRHPELKLVETYIDNGYTGTNFDRPEFERMMQDVRAGQVRCIVVKDLSRFGRDYLETGYYIETILPKIDVRFIAINDDFDSDRSEDVDGLTVPIKNMVNNLYAKDISKKLCAAHSVMFERGEMVNASVPYGYRLNRIEKTFDVDDETAPYVRMMFLWFHLGVPKAEIARRLDFIKAPLSSVRKAEAAGRHDAGNSGKWSMMSVEHCLKNQAYTGDLVQGKSRGAMYKEERIRNVDKEEWIVHRNHHEPIILRQDFEKTQEILASKKEDYHNRNSAGMGKADLPRNPLKGMVFCACCGKRMVYTTMRRRTDGSVAYSKYLCKTSNWEMPCGGHTIKENLLKMLVMDQVNLLVRTVCDNRKAVEKMSDKGNLEGKLTQMEQEIRKLSTQMERIGERMESLYMDYAEGVLDSMEYRQLKEHYIRERQDMELRQSRLNTSLRKMERKAGDYFDMADRMGQHLERLEFDEEFVHELVDAVYVGLDNDIEVKFKCGDPYRELMDYMEEVSNE